MTLKPWQVLVGVRTQICNVSHSFCGRLSFLLGILKCIFRLMNFLLSFFLPIFIIFNLALVFLYFFRITQARVFIIEAAAAVHAVRQRPGGAHVRVGGV